MKKARLIILSFFLILLSSTLINDITSAQSTWDRYVKRTLQEIIELHSGEIGGADIITSAHDFASRVTVVYMGKHQLLNVKRAKFLDMFYIGKPKIRALYESEVLVREGKQQFWLPIQKELLPYLLDEVKEGEQFIVFASWLGGFKENDTFEWVFTINAFKSLP
jgi:hypothetical protein